MEEGDRNTKFFHISAKIRGATNKISKISYNGQEWSEQSTLKSAAVEFFSSTFRNLVNQIDQEIFKVNLPTVSEQQNSDLLTIPSAEEIKDIVFGLKRSSAPGPDGFSSSFFTHCWSIVRDTVITAVNFFSSYGKLLKATNNYFLDLIPKVQSPTTFGDFRPISLLNFTYKIISKIMASRLAAVLPNLISTNQSAFLKSRNIHDNVAIAHELTQLLKRKSHEGSLCLKQDISKAFVALTGTTSSMFSTCSGSQIIGQIL